MGYGGSLYHLFYAGRVDIMLYLQPPLLGVCIDAPEPLLYAVEQSDLTSRFAESLSTERDVAVVGLLYHVVEVGQYGVAVLILGHLGTLLPELLATFAHGRYEIVLLHVSRRQSAVEIVYYRNCLHFVFYCVKFKHFRRIFCFLGLDHASYMRRSDPKSEICFCITGTFTREYLMERSFCHIVVRGV